MLLTWRHLNIELFNTVKGFVSIVKNPSNTESVFDIEDGLMNADATKLSVEYVKQNPAVAQIIQERYIAPPPDIELLLKYPENSLGYIYASYLLETGFDPNFYRKLTVKDNTNYILLRLRQTHDIWHLVTGFGTDVVGELGLQAFVLAQTRRPMSVVLIAGGLLKILLQYPTDLENLLDCIALGYRMGAKAKPFLAQKWEENWKKTLSEWREELGVEPTTVYIP
ncbi:MAG: Coq4 family protein [Microcoleaceae cyanobacterium MO_207.B10]|nr:Coq4 family protein [Microcoleaceae cyanobacterium MO_207.B10]